MSGLRVCVGLVVGALGMACGGSSPTSASPPPGAAPDGPDAPNPARAVTFRGTVSGGDHNGTIEITVPNGAGTAGISSSSIRPQAVVEASGALRFVDGGGETALAGTYDDVTGQLAIAGGPYAVEGTIPPSARSDGDAAVTGTLRTPSGEGIFLGAQREQRLGNELLRNLPHLQG